VTARTIAEEKDHAPIDAPERTPEYLAMLIA
jgi:hypothetical protein